MDERGSNAPGAPAGAPANASDSASHDEKQKDHFLQLMFFQAHNLKAEPHAAAHPDVTAPDFAPLPHTLAKPGDRYALPLPSSPATLRLDAPATEVMTDLRRIKAVTIGPNASIDAADQAMIARAVRALFVADDEHRVLGIITATDILGERPIQFVQQRGVRRGEIVVRDIMTPADRLEILDFRDVARARVGDIVATLKLAGRQHALVVEASDAGAAGQRTVRGIFSVTQIARQLGIAPQQVHDIARTFAEIEAVIAS